MTTELAARVAFKPISSGTTGENFEMSPPKKKVGATKSLPRGRRTNISKATKVQLLTEAGYRCSNPSCSTWVIDLHHIDFYCLGADDSSENLIALCPNCHRRVHRKEIKESSLRTWKLMLATAYIRRSQLLMLLVLGEHVFLPGEDGLFVSGDGVLMLADLLAAHLVQVDHVMTVQGSSGISATFRACLTPAGRAAFEAWKQGDLKGLNTALQGVT